MDFNTNDLGYKIRRGIKGHSEQLNKYVAGLIDSDGSIGFKYTKSTNGKYTIHLTLAISQSFSNDPDSELLRGLQRHYGLGKIYYTLQHSTIARSSSATWLLNSKDSQVLLGRLMKHLRVKGTHAERMLYVVKALKGLSISREALDELKGYRSCSRGNSMWLKMPKHLSWAWVAGFMDGDGNYLCRLNRERTYKDGTSAITNQLRLTIVLSKMDSFILNMFHIDFRGNLTKTSDGLPKWTRSMGKQNKKFALPFLKKMRKYSCLPKKYNNICRMIEFHETTRRD